MNTVLHANKLPALTWNHFNVNHKEIMLSDKPDTIINPDIYGLDSNIKIEDKLSLDGFILPAMTETATYIRQNASITKTITIAKNTTADTPLIFDFNLDKNAKLTCLFDIILEENSSANIILALSSDNDATAQYSDLIKIHARENTSLNLICLQMLGNESLSYNNITSYLENNANVTIRQMPLGAKTALASSVAELQGYKATAKIYADYIGHNDQDIDLNYIAHHYGKKSLSEIKMSGILLDSSKKTARGTIDFHRGCKGAVGSENENVLLLNKKVKNKSVPLILCDEDDVSGNHGASIGTLDEDRLFYLQSRGINESSVKELYLDSSIARLKNLLPDSLSGKIESYSNEVFLNE